MTIEKAAHFVGIVSGVFSLATLIVFVFQVHVEYDKVKAEYDKSQIREWQEVAVYSIVSKGPQSGVPSSEIQRAYKDRVDDLPQGSTERGNTDGRS